MNRRRRAELFAPVREMPQIAPVGVMAGESARIALDVERMVLGELKRADRGIAAALRNRRDLALSDHRFISRVVFALFRWRGWIEALRCEHDEERLLLAMLLDSTAVHPVCRLWARSIGRDPDSLTPLGDAPSWTARAEGLKRLLGNRAINADPWQLFPPWLREVLPLPPGNASPKLKYLGFLDTMQARAPLWVRAQGKEPKAIWDELSASGLRPWIHRRVLNAAKIDHEADVHHLPAFQRGHLEIQDLASQAVALACDPDPGERWWDACAGAGGKSLALASIMQGKGQVVASDVNGRALLETVRRARRSPFRNIATKAWDGKRVAGKAASFDGVLVDAPCSAVGTWRRNPDARWTTDRQAVDRLAETQGRLLRSASAGVKPGGVLAYSACTITPAETTGVVRGFLADHPGFQLDPFPHPLDGTETDGNLLIWPQDADSDAMYVARMVRTR